MSLPGHSAVVACVALICALGGGAFAATKLPKASVGAKQLEKNAVTSPKVKDGSLIAADFATARLPVQRQHDLAELRPADEQLRDGVRRPGLTTIPGRMSGPEIAYDDRGLVPVVVQDARTGEVLTLAYANAEAVARTRETGEAHFWSRSRGELWHKGGTSGNTQAVRAIRVDCDADALLYLVEPAGPACHTGARTCFFGGDETLVAADAPGHLDRNAAAPNAGGWTAKLLADPALAGAKVEEEAEEVVRAVREESDERVAEEAADVLFHLSVLLRTRGLSLADAHEVLNGRRR